MQSKSKSLPETDSTPNSPYRMGTWTVTKLKEELRTRQLPISGKKSELIDRLESNSPVKGGAAPNTRRGSPMKLVDLSIKSLESPLKLSSSPLKAGNSPSVNSPLKSKLSTLSALQGSPRGRSRSSSPSHRMFTRSRSTSLSQGTFLTWSRAPLSVLTNFCFAQVENVKNNSLVLASILGFLVSSAVLLYFNSEYRTLFFNQLNVFKPYSLLYLDGLLSNLGFKRSGFSVYISRAARFMFDCSAGNIERSSVSGRLRCSAAPLKFGGLPARLFWLERAQFIFWSLGSISASVLIYFLSEKCRTALPLQINRNFRRFMAFCNRFIYALAIVVPFEFVGLISGLSGCSGNKFGALILLNSFLAIPLQFASRIFYAKYQKEFETQFARLPENVSSISTTIFNFLNSSVYVQSTRQAINAFIYLFLSAAAVQVIANTFVYKRK